MHKTVLFLAASFCSTSTTLMAMYESSPVVGSSQNISEGFVRISDANANRLASPPEIPLISPVIPILVC